MMASHSEAIGDERMSKLLVCVAILEADYEASQALAGFRTAASLTAWRFEKVVAPGVQAWSTALPNSSLRKFLAQGVLLGDTVTPQTIGDLLWLPRFRLQWDKSYSGLETIVGTFTGPGLDCAGTTASLCRLMIAPVLIVSSRDFVSLQLRREVSGSDGVFRPGTHLSVAHGPSTDDRCPPATGYVRGDLLPGSAWLLEPLYEEDSASADVVAARGAPGAPSTGTTVKGRSIGVRMTYVIAMDPKGWVPHAVVNAAVCDTFRQYWAQLREWIASHPTNITP